jgi:hypothetical protein
MPEQTDGPDNTISSFKKVCVTVLYWNDPVIVSTPLASEAVVSGVNV